MNLRLFPLAIAILFALPLHAQDFSLGTIELDTEVRILTLEEALELALEQNRDIHKAEVYGEWVRGKYLEERAAALPQVTITGEVLRNFDNSFGALYGDAADLFPTQQDTMQTEVALDQVLFAWGKVGAALRAAKEGLLTAEDQLRLYRQAALRDVTEAFYDVLLKKELESTAEQALQQKERLYAEAQKKYELGTATEYDVLAAQVAVDNARPPFIRTQSAVGLARQRLRLLLAEEDHPVDARGTLEVNFFPVPAYGDALATALDNRPEIQNAFHKLAIQREVVKIARAGNKPSLDLHASYGRRGYHVGDLKSWGRDWSAGIFLTFPIFDGMRTRGKVIQARCDLTTQEIEALKLRDSVALNVRRALDNYGEAEEIVKALSGTVAQAERLLTMAEQGYKHGVKTNLDVQDAQLNLTRARANLAQARRDYLVARTNLDWVMGVLGEAPSK